MFGSCRSLVLCVGFFVLCMSQIQKRDPEWLEFILRPVLTMSTLRILVSPPVDTNKNRWWLACIVKTWGQKWLVDKRHCPVVVMSFGARPYRRDVIIGFCSLSVNHHVSPLASEHQRGKIAYDKCYLFSYNQLQSSATQAAPSNLAPSPFKCRAFSFSASWNSYSLLHAGMEKDPTIKGSSGFPCEKD